MRTVEVEEGVELVAMIDCFMFSSLKRWGKKQREPVPLSLSDLIVGNNYATILES